MARETPTGGGTKLSLQNPLNKLSKTLRESTMAQPPRANSDLKSGKSSSSAPRELGFTISLAGGENALEEEDSL